MAEYIDAYAERYGKQPRNHTELMNFSKRASQVGAGRKALSFKEAKEIMAQVESGTLGASSASGSAPATAAADCATEESKAEPAASDEGTGKSAMFAELSQGLSVTSGLKKVTADMKTKNRSDRSGKVPAGSTVAKAPTSKPKSGSAAAATKKKKDPNLSKKGLRWVGEYFTEGVQTLETSEASTKEEVYLFGNSNCGFIIPSKVKAVIIDSCNKVQVQLTDVISTVEMINCKRVTLYLQGKVQSIVVDKCSDPKLVMALPCFQAEPKIVTSMISDMMVEVAGDTDEDEFKEYAVPYQFESRIDPVTREMKTVPVEHG